MTNYRDEYRYIRAALAGLNTFEELSRKTGRTTRLIADADDGDLIICDNRTIADYIEQELNKAGKANVCVRVICPSTFELKDLRKNIRRPVRRVHFDHNWTLSFIITSLNLLSTELGSIEAFANSHLRMKETEECAKY